MTEKEWKHIFDLLKPRIRKPWYEGYKHKSINALNINIRNIDKDTYIENLDIEC